MRVKITDGDLVLISISSEASYSQMSNVRDAVEKWTKMRGLQDVTIGITASPDARGFSVTVLSVNDVFEDQVLSGKKKAEE